MKIHPLLPALFLALATSFSVRADEPPAPAAAAKPATLEDQMKAMNRAFRQLKKQVADAAQNTASLALVAKMQAASLAALEFSPSLAGEMPEKDRPAFIADYKTKMQAFIATLARLETALKAGDNAAATQLVTDLNGLQRADHKEFRKPMN
jgi:soluble cytochrome b562